jgi:oxygen-independent coproporphyrinogen-3 oxidase
MKGQDIESYISYLKKELSIYKKRFSNYKLHTIFIGGGTPSAIHERYIIDILDYIYKNYDVSDLKEITIELNPGTITKAKCEAYKAIGINRVSVGVQSLNDKMLQMLGRIHNCNDIRNTLYLLRKAGFDNINVDLMFGLPDQTLSDWLSTVNDIAEKNPEHISCYGLAVEDGTPFKKMLDAGKLCLPDEDTERKMYWKAADILQSKGYVHYEISNFAKKGYECKHNLIYWKDASYIGLGAGAHSYYKGYRYANETIPEKYIDAVKNGDSAVTEREYIDKKNEMEEYFFTGFRLIEGIDINDFKKRFGHSLFDLYGKSVNKLLSLGLINVADNKMYLTNKGIDLSNQVFMEFMD